MINRRQSIIIKVSSSLFGNDKISRIIQRFASRSYSYIRRLVDFVWWKAFTALAFLVCTRGLRPDRRTEPTRNKTNTQIHTDTQIHTHKTSTQHTEYTEYKCIKEVGAAQ